ncbi:MAG: hypothetical protein A2521_14495, partial [Deltaproteobacteria bacterium RIFOXYD12_FULL_57_12]
MRLLLLALAFFALGGFLSLALAWQDRLARVVGAAGAVAGAAVGLLACLRLGLAAGVPDFSVPWITAGITVVLHVDRLALFFLLPIFLLTLCCAVYADPSLRSTTRQGQFGFHWFFFNLLAASMVLVVLAANGLFFLIAWEAMSLSSFFLVTYHYEQEEVRRAGWLYLIATHCGTVFLFLLFLLGASLSSSFDFAAMAVVLKAGSPAVAVTFFCLALIGFGTKAGLFPLHIWLPDAHPAAPSHVSALMSGVMIKTGVYGVLRMVSLLPPLPAWCGVLLCMLGLGGALFGIAMAAVQTDIKRVLAFSSVENIGIIFLGLGLGLFAAGHGQPLAAGLAMAGALLHVWNHALFKGLLFLGAGSLVHGAGSREMSSMGGLLRRMPSTGFFIMAGCVAIAALPPLNGFVSEWLIFLSMLQMGQVATDPGALWFLLLIVLFALVGGLALLAFSRLAGMTLLGEPRSKAAAAAHDSSWLMLTAMAVPFAGCLLIGIVPGVAMDHVAGVVGLLLGSNAAAGLAVDPRLSLLGLVFAMLILVAGGRIA